MVDPSTMDMDLAKDLLGDDPQPGDLTPQQPPRPGTPEPVAPPQRDALPMDEPQPKQALMPDKFKNKSKDDVLASYLELEKDWGSTKAELGALRKFYGQHEHLFRYNPETQMPELNVPLLMQLSGDSTNQPQTPEAPPQQQRQQQQPGSDNFNSQLYDENPQQAIAQMVQNELGKILKQELAPLQRSIAADRHDSWSGWMRGQYADYDKWEKKLYTLAEEMGVSLDNKQKFERFYRMAKADGGGYVDKESALQEIQKRREALSVLRAGVGDSVFGKEPVDETSATVDDLIGMNQSSYSDQDKGTIRALFKKEMLEPWTDKG